MIEFGDPFLEAYCAEFVAISSERVGLDDVRAGFEIGHVNAKDFLGARGI